MGSKTSKVQTALFEGKEKEALALFQEDKQWAANFDPTSPYENDNGNTPLHYAAYHAMPILFKSFINKSATQNPMVKNFRNETPLHKLCQKLGNRDERELCFKSLLDLRTKYPKLQLSFDDVDNEGNTAMHYAAHFGQKLLVEALMKVALPSLTITNKLKRTPADEAEEGKFPELAALMESKVIYGRDPALPVPVKALTFEHKHDEKKGHIPDERKELETDGDVDQGLDLKLRYEVPDPLYKGLNLQAVRSEKDSLMVTVSDILEVPLSAAEALLAGNEWKKDVLIEAWLVDKESVCKKAGIPVPQSGAGLLSEQKQFTSVETTCGICQETSEGDDGVGPLISVACGHAFCRPCWEQYLKLKIEENQRITCPGYKCTSLVPQEVLEQLVVATIAQKYLRFDLNAFVTSNPTMKWCPRPRCDRAVQKVPIERKKEVEIEFRTTAECGNGHFFCFSCGEEAHEPTKCEDWKKWKEEVAKSMASMAAAGGKTSVDVNQMATSIWLAQNTKKCPKCQCSIQKNEGCNHMTCKKCRHEFCWICMEPWRKHGQQTGGFFSCNRYTGAGPTKAQEETKTAKEKEKETERFVHFFERYGAHDVSRRLEEQLLFGVAERMSSLQRATGKKFSADFIEAAFRELLKNRLLLRNSYIYRYYLDDGETELLEELRSDFDPERNRVFEVLQGEMETVTEALSGMVARKRMRNTKSDIIKSALAAREKRQAFLRTLFNDTEVEESASSFPFPRHTHTTHSHHAKTAKKAPKEKDKEKRRRRRHRDSSSSSLNQLSFTSLLSSPPPPLGSSSSSSFSSTSSSSTSIQSLSNAFWVCNQCTLINPGSRLSCDLCRQTKHDALEAQSQSQQTSPITSPYHRHSITSPASGSSSTSTNTRSSSSSSSSSSRRRISLNTNINNNNNNPTTLHVTSLSQLPSSLIHLSSSSSSTSNSTSRSSSSESLSTHHHHRSTTIAPPTSTSSRSFSAPPGTPDPRLGSLSIGSSDSNGLDEDTLAAFSVMAGDLNEWICGRCTFSNATSENICSVCQGPREQQQQQQQQQQYHHPQPQPLSSPLPTPSTHHHSSRLHSPPFIVQEVEDTSDHDPSTSPAPVPGVLEPSRSFVNIVSGGGSLDSTWSCPTCTYLNLTGIQCEMCDTPKP